MTSIGIEWESNVLVIDETNNLKEYSYNSIPFKCIEEEKKVVCNSIERKDEPVCDWQITLEPTIFNSSYGIETQIGVCKFVDKENFFEQINSFKKFWTDNIIDKKTINIEEKIYPIQTKINKSSITKNNKKGVLQITIGIMLEDIPLLFTKISKLNFSSLDNYIIINQSVKDALLFIKNKNIEIEEIENDLFGYLILYIYTKLVIELYKKSNKNTFFFY